VGCWRTLRAATSRLSVRIPSFVPLASDGAASASDAIAVAMASAGGQG
jgi:hypothetical protein